MPRRAVSPPEPAGPEAAATLGAALTAMDFGIATLFQATGNVMAHRDTLRVAVAMSRPIPRGWLRGS